MSFSSAEVKFLRRLIAELPSERRAGDASRRLSEGHGIGAISGTRVMYESADFERARAALVSRSILVDEPTAGFSRSEAGPGLSEKAGARPVTEGLLAVVPMNMSVHMPEGAGFLAVDWEQALRWDYQAVLECENLEPLVRLTEYSWLERYVRGRSVLAIFRGGPQVFRTGPPAAFLRRADKPVLGFYDFDPAGLQIAAGEPNLETLCLPEWEALKSRATQMQRPGLYYPQLKACQSTLDALSGGPVHQAWDHLKSIRCGLDQEAFPR